MNDLGNRIKDASRKLGLLTRLITQEGKGQSLIVIVFAFLGLLAFVGLAVDLGLVYVERVQLGRACDAAALAAAQELPLEDDAIARALEYLALNGYDVSDLANTRIELKYCGYDGAQGAAADDAQIIIKIDTKSYEDGGQCDSASRIKVEGVQKVGMNFMQFFGFGNVSVSGAAVAENINDLDIAIVFDKSGSMEFDTLCYGCWDYGGSGFDYPSNGTFNLLPYNPDGWGATNGTRPICDEADYYEDDNHKYTVIEAEYYSYNRGLWDRDYAVKGIAHWTLQRNTWNSYYGVSVGSSSADSHGGYMKVTPFYYSTYAEGAVAYGDIDANTPRLDYDFHTPPDPPPAGGSGSYYIYLRAQGGRNQSGYDVDPRVIHWGLDGVPQGSVDVDNYGVSYDGARSDRWNDSSGWERIAVTLSGDQDYTLNLWVGGLGFALDKIIITRDDNCTGSGHACREDSWKGPTQTPGRSRDACDSSDRMYDLSDDLYDHEQPVRASKEAVKKFVGRLNHELDQVSYVQYSYNYPPDTSIRSHLYCQKQLGGACQNFDSVLQAIEDTQSRGSTSMGDGMRLGIYTLRTDFSTAQCQSGNYPCGRPRAAHLMILMTDGVANAYFQDPYDDARDSYGHAAFDALWSGGGAKDYVIYQAQQARDNGIVIYAISLGLGADFALMDEVAAISGGEHFFCQDPTNEEQLDYIFDQIFERIFLRLIS